MKNNNFVRISLPGFLYDRDVMHSKFPLVSGFNDDFEQFIRACHLYSTCPVDLLIVEDERLKKKLIKQYNIDKKLYHLLKHCHPINFKKSVCKDGFPDKVCESQSTFFVPFQIALTVKRRLHGFFTASEFTPVWYDPHHKLFPYMNKRSRKKAVV